MAELTRRPVTCSARPTPARLGDQASAAAIAEKLPAWARQSRKLAGLTGARPPARSTTSRSASA
jgi:hypothetical protein